MLRHGADVVTVRQRAREVAALLGFDGSTQTRIATAVSEIARYAFSDGRAGQSGGQTGGQTGGQAEFLVDTTGPSTTFVVRIRNNEPVLPADGTTTAGQQAAAMELPPEIRRARRLVDRLDVHAGPGRPTTALLEQAVPATVQVTAQMLARIRQQIEQQAPQSAIAEVQQQNQELLQTLAELRRQQEELSQLNRELEDTNRGVLALYAELDERADRLRQADEVKSRFLSNMSHELRTPLNSIIALSGLLLERTDGELTQQQEKQANYIRRAAENLSEMVNDLLDLAKVEAGKITIYPETFTVNDLFSALRGMMRPLLDNNSVELIFERPNGLPALYTDEGKVAQILRNLISNALKFTEEGTVRVSATLDTAEDAVVFAVIDTGIGIAAEDQERIFQEFGQLDHPIQQRVKGTGLGLPLSRKLAELLGGSLTVESEIDQGSTFLARIPCVYREEVEMQFPAPSEAQATTYRAKILHIDDNETDRYILRNLLANTVNELVTAVNGAEGLQIAAREQPAVIFLDLALPDMSGFQVLSALQSDPLTAGIPVVILTSKELVIEEEKQLALQAAAILSKALISQSVVQGQIEALLADRPVARSQD